MAGSIVKIELGGMVFYVDTATEIVKILLGQAASTTGVTFQQIDDNVDYQVPTGKTFKALGLVVLWIGGGNKTTTILQADAADGTTGEIVKAVFVDKSFAAGQQELPFAHLPTFAADKYVNAKVSNTSSAPVLFYMIGVEY